MTFGDPPNAYFAPTARDLAAFEAGKAEAAALIASQAARIRELEEGLEPFAGIVTTAKGWVKIATATDFITSDGIRWEDFRRARSLLSRKGGE